MANEKQDIRNQQSGSGSQSQHGQGDQSHKNQPGQQPSKKDVQSNKQGQETEKTGTR
jgi:hypothetical protein